MKHVVRSIPDTRQRGVIMVVALVTLVVLMIGAVALIRSMSASQQISGTYGFKRDMANQAAQALVQVRTAVLTGGLASSTARQSNNAAENYSATILPTTPEGIPQILLQTDSVFNSSGFATTAKNIVPTTVTGITISYVIDRLCNASGPPSAANCMLGSTPTPTGASAGSLIGGTNAEGAIVPQAVYRLTIKVTGPLNAQAFYQSTFTV